MGQKLSDLTSQRVVVGILTMLFFIPGFASNYMLWGAYPSLAGGALPMLHTLFLAQGGTPSFDLVRPPRGVIFCGSSLQPVACSGTPHTSAWFEAVIRVDGNQGPRQKNALLPAHACTRASGG